MRTNITVGILAHVDAGKTTLSEALLYKTGAIRKLGRVDSGSTVMDYNLLERQRGITIFFSEAHIATEKHNITLLDTPGHVDFSSETERTLAVLDYAVLVISGSEPIQSHTKTLWKLLKLYHIPTLLFVTKMDVSSFSKEEILLDLQKALSPAVIDFSSENHPSAEEAIALTDEDVLEKYLENGRVDTEDKIRLIKSRLIFPCYFGSGLKDEGIDTLLEGFDKYCTGRVYPEGFGAKVFKITHDDDGAKITHLKITGGKLKVRDSVKTADDTDEKVSQIRICNGNKFISVDEAVAGDICAVKGLINTVNGQGLGNQISLSEKITEPVMCYRVNLPEGMNAQTALPKLRRLEEEDPQLHISWTPHLQQISALMMGQVQAEVFASMVNDRFGFDITLDEGKVLYKETVTDTVEGVGHYEPLRHYAEVHILIEPLPRNSGLVFATKVNEDELDRNWQRLISEHLKEKQHLGVLTGAPLTDVKLTLVAGRAHLKHTEGGDFRQATYRAVRQGLMQSQSVLLEPYYAFVLELPSQYLGRAVTDIRMMNGSFDAPDSDGVSAVIKGTAPVTALNGYSSVLASYTGGTGKLFCENAGYDICRNAEQVIKDSHYVAEADLDNTPDSVFCAHGAGFNVKWDKVSEYMHLPSYLKAEKEIPRAYTSRRFTIDDKELAAIMEKEFGKPNYELRRPKAPVKPVESKDFVWEERKLSIIVDAYNVIFCWEDLKILAKTDLEAARLKLLHILENYAAFTGNEVVVVFDAYKVDGGEEKKYAEKYIKIIFTKENELADVYIEKLISKIGKNEKVRIVSSDNLIKLTAAQYGIMRVNAVEFEEEILRTDEKIEEYIYEKKLHTAKNSIGENIKQNG